MLKVKRIYERPEKSDGLRILVDRLWPRSLTKQKAHVDKWLKEIAPSNDLRKWFTHKEERWKEFKKRYFEELKSNGRLLKELRGLSKNKSVALLYASKNKERNNAKALLEFLKNK